MATKAENKDKQMLAEALSVAFGAAQRLGIDIGGDKITLESANKTAKSKPEGKMAKVDRYTMLLSTGNRQSKADLLNRI